MIARGNLAIEFCRLAGRLRPRWIVWENVPGVLSSNGGRDFGSIIGTLAELGYGCAWRVLDAQFLGVPQRRRRVFVVGHLGDWRRAAAVLLEREGLCRDPPARRKAREGVAGSLTAAAWHSGETMAGAGGHLIPFGGSNSGPMTSSVQRKRRQRAHGYREGNVLRRGPHSAGRRDGCQRGRHRPRQCRSCQSGSRAKTSGADAGARRADVARDGAPGVASERRRPIAVAFRGFGQDGFAASDIAPPVLASDGGTVGLQLFRVPVCAERAGRSGSCCAAAEGAIRRSGRGDGAPLAGHMVCGKRFTPRECERLQGLPDNYTLIPTYREVAGHADRLDGGYLDPSEHRGIRRDPGRPAIPGHRQFDGGAGDAVDRAADSDCGRHPWLKPTSLPRWRGTSRSGPPTGWCPTPRTRARILRSR